MKFKILLCLVAASTMVSASPKLCNLEPDCDVCRYATLDMFTKFLTDGWMIYQLEFISDSICNGMDDSNACNNGFARWWSSVASKIYTFENARYVCNAINSECALFKKQKCGLWDCETCIADMSQFGQVMSSETFALKVVNELNGEMLCEDPSLALDGDQIRDCKIFTKTFVPIALQQLFNVEGKTVYPEMWCKEIFDIC